MKLCKPANENYAAVVVQIKNLIPLDNCDNVQHASIFGNLVVVGNDVRVGDQGIFFPVECQLSSAFLSANNLYRKHEKNEDLTKKGYFEDNGRIRCVKFRGNKSEGLFMPLECLDFVGCTSVLPVGSVFDNLLNTEICCKYVVKQRNTHGTQRTKKKENKFSKIIDSQFRFHSDTAQLGRNLHRLNYSTRITISQKYHGTSVVISKVLCRRKLSILERVAKLFGANVQESVYDDVYSSRKVIKNQYADKKKDSYYKEDIWGLAYNQVKEHLTDGISLYGEIVGYLPSGSMIQKGYDYGCEVGEFRFIVYRISYTANDGKVFEFSSHQMSDWCYERGIEYVRPVYSGDIYDCVENAERNHDFVSIVKSMPHMEELDPSCKNDVPFEGYVVRIEGPSFEAYKVKATAFLERETKNLDSGEEDIEEQTTERKEQ